jgi:hypothetical protein
MKLWRKLAAVFGIVSTGAYANDAKPREQALIVHFRYGSKDLGPLFELEDALDDALAGTGAGEYDGNEMAVDEQDCHLYMHGPDADRLYEVVAPVLKREAFMSGARIRKRYGSPEDGAREVEIQL